MPDWSYEQFCAGKRPDKRNDKNNIYILKCDVGATDSYFQYL